MINNWKRMKKLKNSDGFTLVELIIVLVILAILAAFTIPAMLGFVGNSKEKLCESARNDCLRYYQTQATEKLPKTREEAIPILAKAIQNSYGDATVENNVAKGVCPAGGEYKLEECKFELENGYYRLKEVPCSIHHDKDSSRPNLDKTKSLADRLLEALGLKPSEQEAFISEFYKENNNTLLSVDEIDLKAVFGDDWQEKLYRNPSELYWRPLTVEINGKTTYVNFANDINDGTRGNWAAYIVEVNGTYYRSTQKAWNNQAATTSVAGPSGGTRFNNEDELNKWLLEKGFEKVT